MLNIWETWWSFNSKAFLGYEEGVEGGTTLAQEDVRFEEQ